MSTTTINLTPAVAEAIGKLATEKQTETDALVNEILEQYVLTHPVQSSSHADFLLSMAGMFDSGQTDTSENVEATVKEFILQKHGKEAE